MVLVEGEEFVGSPHIPGLIERYALDLATAEAVIWPCRGTSGPSSNLSTRLGLGVLTGASLGYASGHAGPDEFLVIEGDGRVGGLGDFIGSLADLVLEFAGTS